MSSENENKSGKDATTTERNDFGEPRKMVNETFDTEEDEYSERSEEEEEEDLPVDNAAMDVLDQLVELFVEKNGREPNQEEVMQWIDVFKSLQIDDCSPQGNNKSANDDVIKAESPTASE
eukprot:scaffold24532_cov157-Cylindrotheca_fusiformis.AAC.8